MAGRRRQRTRARTSTRCPRAIRDDADSAGLGARLHRARPCEARPRVANRRRRLRAAVLSRRASDRPPRVVRRCSAPPDGDRRHRPQHLVSRATGDRAADGVPAVSPAGGRRRDDRAVRGRLARRCRGRHSECGTPQAASGVRAGADAHGAGRGRAGAGAAARDAGQRLRRAGAAPGGDRPLRPARVHGDPPRERDRHPHGARRAADRGCCGSWCARPCC